MKQLADLKKAAVIGAGTMGLGIAQLCAAAGMEVVLYDLQAAQLDKAKNAIAKNLEGAVARNKMSEEEAKAAKERILYTPEWQNVIADIIIEAVVEKLDVKIQIFKDLDIINGPDTILATNTSSIPITQIAAHVPNPERVVGMHFFNPAHIMKLVEVISGASTAPETALTIKALAEKLGKQAVMANDSPGFIVNRVARLFYLEGLKALEEQVADIGVIDDLMEASGFRMGPFRLMDLIGIDTNFSVTESMFAQFYNEARFRPSRIQKQKVEAGHWGKKSGKGFYDYSNKN